MKQKMNAQKIKRYAFALLLALSFIMLPGLSGLSETQAKGKDKDRDKHRKEFRYDRDDDDDDDRDDRKKWRERRDRDSNRWIFLNRRNRLDRCDIFDRGPRVRRLRRN